MKNLFKVFLISLLMVGMAFAQAQGSGTNLLCAPNPSGVNAQYYITGTSGGATAWYWVVAVYNGGMIQPINSLQIGNLPNTLNGSNYVTIAWQPPNPAPIGYWVLKSTTSSNFPGSGTVAVNSSILSSSTLSQNDQGNALNSFTFSGLPQYCANWSLDNIDYTVPAAVLRDSNGVLLVGYPVGNTEGDITGAEIGQVYTVQGSLTLAQVNSGTVIIPANSFRKIRVVGFLIEAVGGTTAACTQVQLQDTTAVVSIGVNAATLVSGTIINEATSGITLTTFLTSQMTSGAGLQIAKTGSACTTTTSYTYRVFYTINT